MMPKRRLFLNILRILAGIAISGAGIYIFLDKVSLKELKHSFADFNPFTIAIGCFLALFTLWLRSLRWRVILPDKPGVRKDKLYGKVNIAFMINNIVPFRIGEAVRAYLLWRRNRFSAAVSIGSIILERIFDVVMFFLFFSIPIFLLPKYSDLIRYANWVVFAAIGIISVLLFMHFFKDISRRLFNGFLSLLPIKGDRLGQLFEDILSNLEWMDYPVKWIKVVVLSLLTSGCYAGIVSLLTVQMEALSFIESFFIVAFSSAGAAIPLAPGYVGTLHAVMKEGFLLSGATESSAVAATVIYHAITYIPVTIAGIYFFWSMRIGVKDVIKAENVMDKREVEHE